MGYWVEDLLLERGSLKTEVLRLFLMPFSVLYWIAVRFRNFLYDHAYLPIQRAALPVISVGNIVAGGTGKTPLVHLLVKSLLPFCSVAIISRGYRSKAEKERLPLLASTGNGPLFPPAMMGDEPYLLSLRLPKAIVVVGRDRLKAISIAKKAGAQICVLDDGMQSRNVHRDLEVVTVDGNDPLGGGSFLPCGFLRDEPRRLSQADLIVVRGKNPLAEDLSPVVETEFRVEAFSGSEKQPLEGRSVALFSGIARPSRFVETVKKLGAQVTATLFCKDHGLIAPSKLLAFAKSAQQKGASMLLCTEKDYVKINPENKLPLPVVYTQGELVICSNKSAWETFLSTALTLTKRSI